VRARVSSTLDGPLFGAIETGGTTTRVAVALRDPDGRVARSFLDHDALPTTDPKSTVERALAWFSNYRVAALGVAAFGPIDVDPSSSNCGTLLATPKPGWSNFPLRAELDRALRVPVAIDTDVNAAAIAEQKVARETVANWPDHATLAYVTVGTGVGVGVALDGRAHHGALHPEAGHLIVRRAAGDDFVGLCPFHRDCLEGLASGPALAARAKVVDAALLRPDHDAWRFEADYLAQLVVAIVGLLAPHAIVLGGGVMRAHGLLDRVRARAAELSNGYSPLLTAASRATTGIVAPRLAQPGLVGALELAMADLGTSGRPSR
jgi:fructokinase